MFDRTSIIILAIVIVAAILVRNSILRIGEKAARDARSRKRPSNGRKSS
ncbi:MAG TPA: hypothetical protein VKS22_16340 [Candidatus Binataceae bacterium]|nr:hypothetical protein [Candidatus Binataceae bacterium]